MDKRYTNALFNLDFIISKVSFLNIFFNPRHTSIFYIHDVRYLMFHFFWSIIYIEKYLCSIFWGQEPISILI